MQSTSALSVSRARSGMMTPRSMAISHPLVAAHHKSQSKLDEDLHLLQVRCVCAHTLFVCVCMCACA